MDAAYAMVGPRAKPIGESDSVRMDGSPPRMLHGAEIRIRDATARLGALADNIAAAADRLRAEGSGQIGVAVKDRAPDPPPGSVPAIHAALRALEDLLETAEREFSRIQDL